MTDLINFLTSDPVTTVLYAKAFLMVVSAVCVVAITAVFVNDFRKG